MATSTDMRRFFEARQLTAEELDLIEYVLLSPAYERAFKPYLESIRESMRELWLDRAQARKDVYPDDFLAGGVAAIEGLLTFFKIAVAEANTDRIQETFANMTSEKQYELKRQQGKIRPVIGVDQRAEPDEYNPLDDI
jgi:hypothetical protein